MLGKTIAISQPCRIESSLTLACLLSVRKIEDSLKKVIAIYPGSFDPPTNGHLDLIERGSKIFDELIVAILRNPDKNPLFSLGERRAMLEALTADFKNVQVDVFDGLTVDYAARVKASAVLRGIRALSDYEYELQMAMMNRKLQPDLETVFMMPAEQYSYLSSRLVREVAKLGGSIQGPGAGNGGTPAARKTRSGHQAEGRKKNEEQENEHDSSDGSDPGPQTYGTNQPHRTFCHHGGGGRSRQAAPARH